MQHFLPANLDLDALLEKHPPREIKGFKKDYLIHILHLITSIPATNKDLDVIKGFVPIYTPILQKKVKNYRAYLDYLLDHNIIKTDDWYIKGQKSIGYKFAPRFSEVVKPVTVSDRSLRAALRKESVFSTSIIKKYNHLIKWYNPHLQINYDAALAYLTTDFERKQQNPELRDFDLKTKQFKNPLTQFNSSFVNIERIRNHEFKLCIDDNVFRFHSVLSNLKSEVRNFITYRGENLVSVDIKNSQPYLSTLVLNQRFWSRGLNNRLLNIQHISISLLKYIFPNNTNINSYIMLSISAEIQAGGDFQRYKTLVRQGKFYEYLAEEIGKELGVSYSDRRKVKAAVFQVLFTDNRFLGQKEAKPKKVFKNLFPLVYALFSKIKQQDKTNLPRLLQRIESHLILLVVTKRIARERPKLPIFTIHDSIVTTVGNEEYVQSILIEELEKAVGIRPSLSVEYWKPENLQVQDQKIYFGDDIVAA